MLNPDAIPDSALPALEALLGHLRACQKLNQAFAVKVPTVAAAAALKRHFSAAEVAAIKEML